MGADWVSLFDKQVCDEIVSLNSVNISSFVQLHLPDLHELSEFKSGFEQDVPIPARLGQLRELGRTDEQLKADLVEHLCVSSERLIVDYWGCYAELFATGDPPGSIADYRIFPHIQEQGYLLLQPAHVQQMLMSLEEHRGELRVMTESQLDQLRQWKMQCVEDPRYMLAYFYDA